MNEEIVEEIYDKLVEHFGIIDICLPKRGKRKFPITWKQFIKAAIIADTDKLHTYCMYTSQSSLNQMMTRRYSNLMKDKKYRHWSSYFLSLLGKKRCSVCKSILEYEYFSKDIHTTDEYTARCKTCCSKLHDKYYQENKESVAAKRKKYYLKNKDSLILQYKKYYQSNKYTFNARNARYRATKLQAAPNWANLIAIKEIYRTCPTGYHVDHIVPLQGKLVCGLHCEFNLQQLPASENLSKGNKFEV